MFKLFSSSRNNDKLVFSPKDVYGGALLYNSDIILTTPPTKPLYNFDRLNVFLENIKNKRVDSIRIIKYGIEAEMYVLSLFYDGNKIIYIKDSTKSNVPTADHQIKLHIGNRIYTEDLPRETVYYFETINKEKLPIVSIKK